MSFDWCSLLRLTPDTNLFLRLSEADQTKLGIGVLFILGAAFLLAWDGFVAWLSRG